MISIVTGTIHRDHLLPNLIKNTVDADERLELVLVDGNTTNETANYIKSLNHPRIKFIEVGGRSSYPHFMNLGIKNSSYEWVCQWNDDILLINSWDEVISELDEQHDFYLFNWKYGSLEDTKNPDWLLGKDTTHPNGGWCVTDEYEKTGDIVMNYGIYNKKIFREIGMYNSEFGYYYADADMSRRAHLFGYKHKKLSNIKVVSFLQNKVALQDWHTFGIYEKCHREYKEKIINENIEFLK